MHVFWVPDSPSTNSTQPSGHETSLTPPSKPLRPLPPEILQLIFANVPRSHLTQLAAVCRSWHDVAMPIIYRHIYICTEHHWRCLVQTLTKSTASRWTVHVQSIVLKKSPRLVPASTAGQTNGRTRGYVRLEPVPLDHTGLEDMDENSPEVDSSSKEAEWLQTVTDSTMAAVISYCPNLQYLYLSGCQHIGDLTLQSLSRSSRRTPLLGLWLALARNVTPNTLLQVVQKDRSLSDGPHLTHLDLSYCSHLDDATLQAVLAWWGPSLTHLRLDTIYNLTDITAYAIAAHAPRLRLLHLVRCFRMTNAPMIRLSRQCPDLVYLSLAYLTHVTEEGVRSFLFQCQQLRWLDIAGTGISRLFLPMAIEVWERERASIGWESVTIAAASAGPEIIG